MSGTGKVAWADLTCSNAQEVRDFYAKVVGWKAEDLEVGGYSDYVMRDSQEGTAVAGICHAQGINKGLPAQWLMYVTVENLDESLAKCRELGGRVKVEPFSMGSFGRTAVIEDPAGAVMALLEPCR
jgi:hypothetical protein